MQLCEIKRFDDKCRIHIPKEYVAGAGGKPNQRAYVSFDEETKEIKIALKQEDEADGNGWHHPRRARISHIATFYL